jgi:hypothetical protein
MSVIDDQSPELKAFVASAAMEYAWLPINTAGALYRTAQTRGLGSARTSEFYFNYNGVNCVGQVFETGILYADINSDWQSQHIYQVARPNDNGTNNPKGRWNAMPLMG